MNYTNIKSNPTFELKIYMAGDIEQAKHIVRKYCYDVGLCVTIEPVEYIYTGGQESGFRIGFINYPRFTTTIEDIRYKGKSLAELLMVELCQNSYTIVDSIETTFYSRRLEDNLSET